MMFCINCGKNLRAGATSCDACGTAIIAVPPTPPEATKSSSPDALKTQASNPTSGEFVTSASSTLPLAATLGAQTGRLLGGRYKLEQCIGSGGMGGIYGRRLTHMDDRLAVQVARRV